MLTAYLVFVVGAFVAALFLFPFALQKTRALASPYPKADPVLRLIASIIDLALMIGIYAALSPNNAVLAATVSPIYLVVRDGLYGGQSFGKMCVGLVAIHLRTGRPAQLMDSLRRNLIFGVPGLNAAALAFESRRIQVDDQGIRLGDRFAGTQVIQGKDAIDLVKAVVEAVRSLLREIRGESQPHRMSGMADLARSHRRNLAEI
jgi:uncharacterized RDD family membrane protein YckC